MFVGMISWITLYHAAMSDPGTGASRRFSHIIRQSACGHSFVILISWFMLFDLSIVLRVEYILALYTFSGSFVPLLGMYVESAMYSRRCPIAAGVMPG